MPNKKISELTNIVTPTSAYLTPLALTAGNLNRHINLYDLGYYITTNCVDLITKGPWVDARAYSSLAAAVTAIGASEKTLLISTNHTLTAALTIPSNVHLLFIKGGMITLGNFDLTINGALDAGNYQIFNINGTGRTIGQPLINYINPYWFGGKPWINTEAQADINVTAMHLCFAWSLNRYMSVFLPTGMWYMKRFGPATVEGAEWGTANLIGTGCRTSVFQLINDQNTALLDFDNLGDWHDASMKDIGFYGNGANNLATTNLLNLAGYSISLENVYVRDSGGNGIKIFNGSDWNLNNVQSEVNDDWGIWIYNLRNVSLLNCNTEYNLSGLLLSGEAGRGCLNYNVYTHYTEANSSGIAIEIKGIRGVRIVDPICPSQIIKLSYDATTLEYAEGNVIDIQSSWTEVEVENGCSNNSIIKPQVYYGNLDFKITDNDGRNSIINRNGSFFEVPITNDFTGTIYCDYTNGAEQIPTLSAGSTSTLEDGSVLSSAIAHKDSENKPCHLRIDSDPNVDGGADGVVVYSDASSLTPCPATTTIYFYLLCKIPSNVFAKLLIQQTGTANYYNWRANDGTWSAFTELSHNLDVPTSGELQLLRFKILTGGATRRMTAWLKIFYGRGAVCRFYWTCFSDNDHQGLVHRLNRVVVGYGDYGIFTDVTRPPANEVTVGTKIFNTSDNFENISDGTNWRDPTGLVT